jgi:hypothetical protein
MKSTWAQLETQFGGKDWEKANGIIINLRNLGASEIELRSVFNVGSSRVHRLDHYDPEQDVGPKVPAHAFSAETLAFLKEVADTWETEDGFPCVHRRPRHYFTEAGITWKLLHSRYEKAWEGLPADRQQIVEKMAYSTFTQYVHHLYPGHHLSRTQQDVCDACIRLNLVLNNPNSTADEKAAAQKELDQHNNAARDQRRAISDFTRQYAGSLVPGETNFNVLPDYVDDDDSDSGASQGVPDSILLVAEDFGQGIALPHYGHVRPSCDYFNSNLMLNMYVMADISRNENSVFLYDERCQKKDKDALCSLRLSFHLEQLNRCRQENRSPPEYFVSIRDNCVGQNKSNVTLKLASYLSLSFYKRVLIVYLIPGHSHMIADRVVAWAKRAISGNNLYVPGEITNKMNGVKSIRASHIQHSDPRRPCYTGWKPVLDKYLRDFPPLFTQFYVFEFYDGKVRMQPLTTSSPEESMEHILCANPVAVGKALNSVLLGSESVDHVTPDKIRLERTPIIPLDASKVKSLHKKYETIPVEHLWYYPDPVVDNEQGLDEDKDAQSQHQPKKPRTVTKPVAPGARRVGRPLKPANTAVGHTQSILNFLVPKKTD